VDGTVSVRTGSRFPSAVPVDDIPSSGNRQERRHVSALNERADYLSRRFRTNPSAVWALREFDALVWALTRIAGPDVVNKWLGTIDRNVDSLREKYADDRHTPSSMKPEILEPEGK
jgi:hypothetical protein